MDVAGLGKLLGVVSGENVFADEIEQQRVEHLEAVRIVYEISEQDVMLEEKLVVVAALDEEKTVLQQRVGFRKIVAEKRAPRLRDRAFLHFAPDAAQCFAHLADHVLAVRLKFGNLRAHHVGLLAVLEKLAAPANPVLALDQDARELVAGLLGDEFQQREVVENVGFDRLLKFRARQRLLQNFGEHLAERGVLGRTDCLRSLSLP